MFYVMHIGDLSSVAPRQITSLDDDGLESGRHLYLTVLEIFKYASNAAR